MLLLIVLGQGVFARKQLGYFFAFADQISLFTVHHDFCRTRAGVVIGTHRHAVGACGEYGQEITLIYRKGSVMTEKVSAFANRSDHFILFW